MVFKNIVRNEDHPSSFGFAKRFWGTVYMALAGMNPKTLQYLMGHSEIGVTLDVYTHTSFENAKDEMRKLSII